MQSYPFLEPFSCFTESVGRNVKGNMVERVAVIRCLHELQNAAANLQAEPLLLLVQSGQAENQSVVKKRAALTTGCSWIMCVYLFILNCRNSSL